jgi:hypothetical protein
LKRSFPDFVSANDIAERISARKKLKKFALTLANTGARAKV